MNASVATDDFDPPARADATLAEVLSSRARRATPKCLTIDIAAGCLVAAAFYYVRPTAWLIFFSAAVCLAAYGCWGLADREVPKSLLVVPQGRHTLWRITRGIFGFIGVLAFATALVVFLGFALGTVQS